MKISRSKKPAIIILVIVCLMITGYILHSHHSVSKSTITSYVQNNKSDLEQYVKEIGTDSTSITDVYNHWNVSYYPISGMVEFLVSTSGFGSSGKYSGFYYSPEDIPMGYQEQPLDLQEHASGWQWNEPNGDNHYDTERIAANWYWFEMTF